MNKVELIIEGRKLETNNNIDLVLNFNFSNLTNPETITTDYSKSFNIVGTQINNNIFGQIWDLKRNIVFDANSSNVGAFFNSSKKANCDIIVNGMLFKSGYIKLNNITIEKGVWNYNITFYSNVASFLHTLNDKKLVDLTFTNNLSHVINANNIVRFFNNTHTLNSEMTYIMANNGIYDDFDCDKHLTKDSNGNYVVDNILGEIKFDECSKREYRSYKQRPALKVKHLLDTIISDYNNESTDIKASLDINFFNANNPYYGNSVMTLPLLGSVSGNATYIGETNHSYAGQYIDSSITDLTSYIKQDLSFTAKSESYGNLFDGVIINFDNIYETTTQIDVEFEISLNGIHTITPDNNIVINVGDYVSNWSNNAPLCKISCYLVDENNNIVEELQPFSEYDTKVTMGPSSQVSYKDEEMIYIPCNLRNPYTNYKNEEQLTWYPVHFYSNNTGHTGNLKVQVRLSEFTSNAYVYGYYDNGRKKLMLIDKYNCYVRPITKAPQDATNLNNYYPAFGIDGNYVFSGNDITITSDNKISSNAIINKNTLINDEITQGDFLISYIKQFGLIFDNEGKDIVIKTKNEYFKDYEIIDWSNKIDYSKSIVQTPLTFDSKYLDFSNKQVETHYESYYSNKVGKNYGSQIINTGFEFNNNTKNLNDKTIFEQTVMSNEKTRILVNGVYNYITDEKVLPAYFILDNNERNPSDNKYSLLFDNGLKSLNNRVIITDDIAEMLDSNIGGGNPCWIDTSKINSGTYISNYPQYSTLTNNGNYSWDIGYPIENYANWTPNDYPQSATIYNGFWKNYISEIYNVNNKIVKCWVNLDITDIQNFSFKNFVVAFDSLWHVNKINNYSLTINGSTEVELIKVSDIVNYYGGQRSFPAYFNITYNLTGVTSTNTQSTIKIGQPYHTQLNTVDTSSVIATIRVYMGGVDITKTAFNAEFDTIDISEVTGDIVIEATQRV